jgi:hypothetical protein
MSGLQKEPLFPLTGGKTPGMGDVVLVGTQDGRFVRAVVSWVRDLSNPQSDLTVMPDQTLKIDHNRSLGFSATPRRGCWSWPTS